MPKKIDPALRVRAVRLIKEHQQEYPSLTAAAAAVAKQVGVGKETVRRWVIQDQVDNGTREGLTTEEHEEIKRLKGECQRTRGLIHEHIPFSTPAVARAASCSCGSWSAVLTRVYPVILSGSSASQTPRSTMTETVCGETHF